MKKTMRLIIPFLAMIILLGILVKATRANPPSIPLDWPIFRHDAQHTAMVENKSDLTTPAVAWKRFLGGSVSANGIWTVDIDGDGANEVLMTVGGRLVAKRMNGRLLWDTPPRGYSSIFTVEDLDGDHKLDVLVTAPSAPYGWVTVYRAIDGLLQWESPHQDTGNVGIVHLADLDKDGLDDLFISDQCCGGICNSGYATGYGYSFALGFDKLIADQAKVAAGTMTQNAYEAEFRLFTTQSTGYGSRNYCGQAYVLGDVDGDGYLDVVVPDAGHLFVFSGQTGAIKPYSNPGFTGAGATYYIPQGLRLVDFDGDGRDEILLFNDYSSSGSLEYMSTHRVTAVKVDGTTPGQGTMKVMWQRAMPIRIGDRAIFNGMSIMKFNPALPRYAVAFSTYDSTNSTWTTSVLDTSTWDGVFCDTSVTDFGLKNCPSPPHFPTVIATFPGEILYGTVDLDGDNIPEIITYPAASTGAKKAYKYQAAPSPAFTPLWTMPSLGIFAGRDLAAERTQYLSDAFLTIHAGLHPDLSHPRELLVSLAGTVQALAADTSQPHSLFQHPLSSSATTLSAHVSISDPATGVSNVLLNRNDGFIEELTPDFILENDHDNDGVPDLQSGGYSTENLRAVDFKDATLPRMSLLVTDNRNYLLRLNPDPSVTDLAHPPRADWANAGWGSLLLNVFDFDRDTDNKPELVIPSGLALYGYASNGTTALWKGADNVDKSNFTLDPLPGDFNGDGVGDAIYTYTQSSNDILAYGVINGASHTGAIYDKGWTELACFPSQGVWSGLRAVYPRPGVGDLIPFTYAAHNSAGDGNYPMLGVMGSGAGAPPQATIFAKIATPHHTALPTVFDLNGDHVDDFLLSGGSVNGLEARQLKVNLMGSGTADCGSNTPDFNSAMIPLLWAKSYGGTGNYAAVVKLSPSETRVFSCMAEQPICYLLNGATGEVVAKLQLAGGGVYNQTIVPPQSAPADVNLGFGGSPLAVTNLTGAVVPVPAFVVGATDGYLYAIDARDGAKVWALNLRYPVASPIAADIDNDGKVELVVSVADGYLYGIDQAALAAPAFVYDNDDTFTATFDNGPDRCSATPPEDLDCGEHASQLSANWGAVPDYLGSHANYELAFVSPNGTYIQYWTDMGTATHGKIDGLQLNFNYTYYAVVRAYVIHDGTKLVSPERYSDGVKIVDTTPPVVTLTASPMVLTDMQPTSIIQMSASDFTSITSLRFNLLGPTGATVMNQDELGMNVPYIAKSYTFAPDFNAIASPSQTFLARAGADDVGGHHVAAPQVPIIVCAQYFVWSDGLGACVCPDLDGDTYLDMRCGGEDCDDTNPDVHPGAPEYCDSNPPDTNCDTAPTECPYGQGCIDRMCRDSCGSGESATCPSGTVCIDGYCYEEQNGDGGAPDLSGVPPLPEDAAATDGSAVNVPQSGCACSQSGGSGNAFGVFAVLALLGGRAIRRGRKLRAR